MIKWGIVGLGHMANNFASAIKEVKNAMFKKVSKHWRNNQMQYWLMKSEPDVWSIDKKLQLN